MGSAKQRHDFSPTILDAPAAAGLLHYACAMAVVAVAFGGLVVALGRAAPSDAAAQMQDAVMVDLPPVEAGSHPQGDDAPSQEAAPASTGAEAPQPTPTPPEEVTPPKPPAPMDEKLPQAPAPAAVLEQPATLPPQAQAPASAPQAAHETGAPAKAATDDEADSPETHRASAHLITLWQKALMGRLQAARHGLAAHPATGIARIAFEIDRDGRLVAARVAHSSGSAAVDAAAMRLVRRAAPFPHPPADARETELTFVVPISFTRGD